MTPDPIGQCKVKDLKGNQPKDRAQELESLCVHSHVMRHSLRRFDGDLEKWWQCEDCEVKFTPESVLAVPSDGTGTSILSASCAAGYDRQSNLLHLECSLLECCCKCHKIQEGEPDVVR